MTASKLISFLTKVPSDTIVVSNSGWECDPTDIGGIYYCKERKEVHLTQGGDYGYHPYNYENFEFECVYNFANE